MGVICYGMFTARARIWIRACYEMAGTDLWYCASRNGQHPIHLRRQRYCPRASHAMSGTDIRAWWYQCTCKTTRYEPMHTVAPTVVLYFAAAYEHMSCASTDVDASCYQDLQTCVQSVVLREVPAPLSATPLLYGIPCTAYYHACV